MTKTYVDLMIRLKNGYMIGKGKISAPYSKLNENILKILEKEGYIKSYQVKNEDKNKKFFSIDLKYEGKNSALKGVEIISKSGRRIYSSASDLKPVLGGLGILVLTTPLGILTGEEASKKKTGGELLFKIW